jgi:RNA polymerase-binding protein DksA
MLRAPHVVKISAREPDMAGTTSAGRGKPPSGESTRRTRASAPSKSSASPKSSGSSKSKSKSGTGKSGSSKSGAPNRRRTTGASTPDKKTAGRLPVRPGEQRWTAGEIAAMRTQLEDESTELRAEIARAESKIADRLGDTSDGAGDDQADAGAKTYEREHELSLTYNAREVLAQNERALNRIDAETYGVCESCGNAIGKARLQAFPRATLCVKCKQREERR